jgi:hypothetical protein
MACCKKLKFWKKEERRVKELLKNAKERNSELKMRENTQLKRLADLQKELDDGKKIEGILCDKKRILEKKLDEQKEVNATLLGRLFEQEAREHRRELNTNGTPL